MNFIERIRDAAGTVTETSSSSSSSSVSHQLLKESLRQRAADQRHKQVVANTMTWKEKVIPKFSEYKNSKKVRDLCYRGIPPSLRGKVWSLLIGNAHKISDEYYAQLVKVADLLYSEAAERETSLDAQYQLNIEEETRALECKVADDRDGVNEHVDDSFYTARCQDDNQEDMGAKDDVVYCDYEDDYIEDEEKGGGGVEAFAGEGMDDEEEEEEGGDGERIKMFKATGDDDVSDNDNDEGFVDDDEVIVSFNHIIKRDTCDDSRLAEQEETVDILHRSALYDICENDINQADLRQISELTLGLSDVKNHLLSIERDLPRTFPTLAFFHNGGPLEMSLRRILRAFTCYKTDLGYVQGMSFVVAMLLLYMDEVQAFRCFVNLIEKRGTVGLCFYKLDQAAVSHFVSIFDEYFKAKLPQLYKHMTLECISSEMFLIDWNLTLFSKALSLESAARVWDCFLVDGETFILKTSLGILRCLSSKLKAKSLEEILPLLTHVPAEIETEKLMDSIFQLRIARHDFEFKLSPDLESQLSSSIIRRLKKSTIDLFGSTVGTPAKSEAHKKASSSSALASPSSSTKEASIEKVSLSDSNTHNNTYEMGERDVVGRWAQPLQGRRHSSQSAILPQAITL